MIMHSKFSYQLYILYRGRGNRVVGEPEDQRVHEVATEPSLINITQGVRTEHTYTISITTEHTLY